MSTIRERVYDYAKTCAAERAQRRGFPRPLWLVANYLSDRLDCQINELTEDDVWLFINTVGDEYIERTVNNVGPATNAADSGASA